VNDGRLLVLTPLTVERQAVRRGLPGADVVRTGMGPVRSKRSAGRVTERRADSVAVAGVCGALVDGLRPGDIVVASEVRDPDGNSIRCSSGPLAAALRAMGFEATVGPIASWPSLAAATEREGQAAPGPVAARAAPPAPLALDGQDALARE